jgi:hypothetical protein
MVDIKDVAKYLQVCLILKGSFKPSFVVANINAPKANDSANTIIASIILAQILCHALANK